MTHLRFLPLAFLLALAGCHRTGPVRVHVSGNVTYQGKPLPAGVITIEPDPKRGADGPQGYAQIHNGKFDTRDHGRMACEGPAIVSIQGYDGKSKGGENMLGTVLFSQFTKPVDVTGPEPTLQINVEIKK